MVYTDLRQGNYFFVNNITEILKYCVDKMPDCTESCILILLTQDCDIVGSETNEPYLEFLLGRNSNGSSDGNLKDGKNPRFLNIEENGIYYNFSIHDKFRILKSNFNKVFPDNTDTLKLSKENKRLVLVWVAKHYLREAFPDEFNKRLFSNKMFKKMHKQAVLDKVSGIFINVEDEELPETEYYEVDVRLTFDKPLTNEEENQVNEIFEKIFSTESLFYSDIKIVSEDDFTIRDLRKYKRLDKDCYSLNGQALLPDEINIV